MTTSGPRLDPAVQRVVTTRVIRGFSDGVVSIVLASYLTSLGFTPLAASRPLAPYKVMFDGTTITISA